ncbi:MAG: PHP domain-containing protein [Spirochaetales bacterium]|nr:PHP domain-containing protein [Spirochaetales bacterium]
MKVRADLHNHSCLSPCGDLFMSPKTLVEGALETGIKLIALSDHNSAMNLPAMDKVCQSAGLPLIYGIEVTSLEEAHILCLFETLDIAMDMGELLYSLLPDIKNNPEKLGDQVWVDADENIEGEVEKYLGSGVNLSLDDLIIEVHRRGGLFIPAHIDRPMFSIPSQLGFLPPMDYDALESTVIPPPAFIGKIPKNIPLIQNSDAHYPENIGQRSTVYEMEEPGFQGLKMALKAKLIEFHQ